MDNLTTTITTLGDQIAELKLSEAVALAGYLKDRYKLEPATPKFVPPPVVVIPDPIVVRLYSVVLEGLTDATKKISVIRAVRELTGCGLADGKMLIESAPRVLKEGISLADAEAIQKKLQEAGAKVSLK